MTDLAAILPKMEHFEKLIPTAARLYEHMDRVAQTALMPLFLLSILMAYSKDLGLAGAVVGRVKRLVITALLLAVFPALSGLIHKLGSELAFSIDNLQGIDAILEASAKSAKGYSLSAISLLELGNDMILWALVHISYVLLFLARLGLVAFFHFYWLFLTTIAPLLILGYLFESTAQITQNLFKNIVIISLWPVSWSILSAFLKALPYASAYDVEGGYTALVVMNLIIACALLFSPFLVSSFCEGLLVGTGSMLYSAAKAAVSTASPALGAAAATIGSRVYPKYEKFVPKSVKWAIDHSWPKSSGGGHVSRAKPHYGSHGKPHAALIFALLGAASLVSTSASAQAIILHPGKASVFCLRERPGRVVLGDAKYFRVTKLGDRELLLQGLAEGKATNLIIVGRLGDIQNHALVIDTEQVFMPKIGCERPALIAPKPRKQLARLPWAKNNVLSARILSIKWNGLSRDFLSVSLELTNLTDKAQRPHWSRVMLKSGTRIARHSKLWSSRSEIAPRARIEARVEFRKPEISTTGTVLSIPLQESSLNISIPKEALK